jgi:hypothetical protein
MHATELGSNTVRSHWYDLRNSLASPMCCILITCLDLFRVANVEHKVKQLAIPAEPQLDGCAYICFQGGAEVEAPGAYIIVPVVHFERPDFKSNRVVLSMDYYHKYEYTVPDERKAISPGSVPSIERLLQAYLISRRDYYSNPGPFAGLYKAFRDFAENYCNVTGQMPLVRDQIPTKIHDF